MPGQRRFTLETNPDLGVHQRQLDQIGLELEGIDAQLVNTPYTPASIADWSGTSPGNLQAALDRIAAAIGPIP